MNRIAPVSRMTFPGLFFKRFKQFFIAAAAAGMGMTAVAQGNSWTKPSSGSWEELFWSAGARPGAGQNIFITNAGWKAVMISPNTAQNFPQSLAVNSITIASPVDSFNTLFLNYAGLNAPLTVNSIAVSNGAAITLAASALHLNGPTGVGLSIGGVFNQNDFSRVTGNQLDAGYIGAGVYNLNSGTLSVGHVWLGGGISGGTMNQYGGSNLTGIVHLEAGGVYNFHGGFFGAEVYFSDGVFQQRGGTLNSDLGIWRGGYVLESGEKRGDLIVPVPAGAAASTATGWAMQTGGTNFGYIELGQFGGGGVYVLSNGMVRAPAVTVLQNGLFDQRGGSQIITNGLLVMGGWADRGERALARYSMSGGVLSTPELLMDTASFTQDGGTNFAGELHFVNTTHNYYHLGGGLLENNNATLEASWVGGFYQNGGTHRIQHQLTIHGNDLPLWEGFVMRGGELAVSNIVVNSRGIFRRIAGTIAQSGVIILANAHFYPGAGAVQFGPLQLASGDGTNTTLHLPAEPSVVRFGDSSAVGWAGEPLLIIENWAGALSGAGHHRVIFGSNHSALSAQQLDRIRFNNPAGLAPGIYPAVILATGEIVPELAAGSSGSVPPLLTLGSGLNGAMTLQIQGTAGQRYAIEVSTNLVDWLHWTNRTNSNGTVTVTDAEATNHQRRFYRAVVQP